MQVLVVNNVTEALGRGIDYLLKDGVEEDSRNGTVLVAPGPVCTVYLNPLQRVLFSPVRDANPFFHLMESLWMLAGRNDIAWPQLFNQRFKEYSDNGYTAWGAYGWRWFDFFGYDQISAVIDELRKNPKSRRCVVSMWNAWVEYAGDEKEDLTADLHVATTGGKDVPCNTHIYFDIRNDRLNMTVCNRSNDIIWGAYGANAVHMSILQEYMANILGVEVGEYRQFSNNYHAYLDAYPRAELARIEVDCHTSCQYGLPSASPIKLVEISAEDWQKDLKWFMDRAKPRREYKSRFIDEVAEPMFVAHQMHKNGQTEKAISHLDKNMAECDWKLACIGWLDRRLQKCKKK